MKFTSKEKCQSLLLALGALSAVCLLFVAVHELNASPVGSFEALESRVATCIESALACFLVSAGGAAVVEIMNSGQ